MDIHNGSVIKPLATGKVPGPRFAGDVAKALNALLTWKIKSTDKETGSILISEGGCELSIPRGSGSGGGGTPTPATVTMCTLVSFEGNYIVCTPLAGGDDIKVAIHPSLRESLESETPDADEITYSDWDTGAQTRVATMADVVMTQAIRPKYISSDYIWAMAVDQTAVYVDAVELTYISVCDPRQYCTISSFYDVS